MFKRNSKSSSAGFIIMVDEGKDIKFILGDQSYYLMDIIEELDKKINISALTIFISVVLTILILLSRQIPQELSNLSYTTIQHQTHLLELQDSKLKDQDSKLSKQDDLIKSQNELIKSQNELITQLRLDLKDVESSISNIEKVLEKL